MARKPRQKTARTALDQAHAEDADMAKWPSATGRNAKMLAATERERRFVKRKRAAADQSDAER